MKNKTKDKMTQLMEAQATAEMVEEVQLIGLVLMYATAAAVKLLQVFLVLAAVLAVALLQTAVAVVVE
jgi:hypothetical protein